MAQDNDAETLTKDLVKRLNADVHALSVRRAELIKKGLVYSPRQGAVALRIGTGVRAVRDAEGGKPTTSAVVYMALLWCYGLEGAVEGLADPLADSDGQRLLAAREPKQASGGKGRPGGLDNDF